MLNPNPPFSQQQSNQHSPQVRSSKTQFVAQFWGVRGGVATPGNETQRYGGNTSCVEIRVAGKHLIFDAGTGLRVLGKHLMPEMPVESHLFFTHTQWDRIQGFPFFSPAFIPGNCLHIYGPTAVNGASIKQRLCSQMLQPHFPYPIQAMQSDLQFHSINSGKAIALDEVTIETDLVNKEHRAMGYRVTYLNHSVVYAADLPSSPQNLDPRTLSLAQSADLLICNTTNTDPAGKNYASAEAIWETAVTLAEAADVKQLILFRYDPDHNDNCLDQAEELMQSAFPKALLAREGMILTII